MEQMENTSSILTFKDVAQIRQVSKVHVHNVLGDKFAEGPKLKLLTLGRRRLVRREWPRWISGLKRARPASD